MPLVEAAKLEICGEHGHQGVFSGTLQRLHVGLLLGVSVPTLCIVYKLKPLL